MKSILGRKVGMTQVFATDGTAIPVTVIEVLPNVVLQKKTIENDGYEAVQVGYEDIRANLRTKADNARFAKANTTPKRFVRELKGEELQKYEVGETISVDIFKVGELVDVQGVTKGKGFSGVIKRYNFAKGATSHGSGYHRGIGSIATQGRTNNRIHPGRKMAGHHGNYTRTIQNLQIVAVDAEKNALLVKGAIPGPKKSLVTIKSAVKFTKNPKEAKELVDYNAEAASQN
ncbi:TPA: 50S ribosomal protein L3 [bacterium]|jgi:large subunit ribosomal protein L3|nr:50S ribosomal protein L3 [bacterium]